MNKTPQISEELSEEFSSETAKAGSGIRQGYNLTCAVIAIWVLIGVDKFVVDLFDDATQAYIDGILIGITISYFVNLYCATKHRDNIKSILERAKETDK